MDEELLKQLAQWHENDEYQKIVDTILAMPEQDRDYDLTGQLARALNNLGDYETAVEVLLSVENEGGEDPFWHYRLGYAYFYSDMYEQAKEKFERVLELTPEDEDARMFLNWCAESLSPTAETDRLNRRLMAVEAMIAGTTFRQRTDAFWLWFMQNEPKLAEMVEKRGEYDREKMIEFIAEGVKLISDEVNFNIGGDYEFTFAVEGHQYLFYLLPWLISRMPEQFRSKWHFFPCLPGTKGESFQFQMYDKDIQLSDVMVGLEYDQEQNYFNIRFYHEQLWSLSEDQAYHAFYIMMELAIGEGMARIYINDVDRADALEEGMFSLTKLESCMSVALEEADKEIMTRPDERYMVYKMEFDENKDLRYDVVIGTTCFPGLIEEYFKDESGITDHLDACGAKAVFVVMPFGDADRSDLLKLRYEIEDRLTTVVLGEKGSGQEIGIILGGMMGREHLYVDLLLYDAPAFMEKAGDLLMQYPYPFYLAEFRPESRLVAMAGVEAEIPVIPSKPGMLAERMMTFMDCSCDWFAPMADARPLDQAYMAALEAGKQGGYVPVLVKVDETLMECMVMNTGQGDEVDFDLENVRAYRQKMLGTELPAMKDYFEGLIQKREEEWRQDKVTKEEKIGEIQDGKPNNDLAGYWNYSTRLTDEVLLVRVPVDRPWKIFAWLPMGNWNECPDTPVLMAVAKYWYETYGAVPANLSHDELEFYVEKPVESQAEAMELAMEHYVFCPDCVDQCGNNDTIGKRADSLRQSTIWYFWWD